MSKKRRIWIFLVISILLFITVYAVNWDTNSQADFDLGTYANTFYDVDSIKLNASNGTYTGQIFDAGKNSAWNSISWGEFLPSFSKTVHLNPTYAEDEWAQDITSQIMELDSLFTWERVEVQSWNDTLPENVIIDSVMGYCYLKWIDPGAKIGFQVSRDNGTTWDSEVCKQNAAESSEVECDLKTNSGVDTVNEINNLRMRCTFPTAGQNKWYSTNWVHVFVDYHLSTDLKLQVRSCNNAICDGESFVNIPDISPQNLNIDNNRYFQYKFYFETDNPSINPELYNVSVDYNILNVKPTVTLNSPQNNVYLNSVLLNATVFDSDFDLLTVQFFIDDLLVHTENNVNSGSSVTYDWLGLTDGLHNWTVIANDGTINSNSKDNNPCRYFTVDKTFPNLIINNPINQVYLLHHNENNLDLKYSVGDANLVSCWYTKLSGQNQSLSGCKNTTIKIPDKVNDTTYNIKVYADDLAGNIQEAEVSFITNYSQGIIGNLSITLRSKEFVNAEFSIGSSAICIHDWCEKVVVSLDYDSVNCNLTGNKSYDKGDLNKGDIVSQDWTAKCTITGIYNFSVNYSSHNNLDQISQNISIEKTPVSLARDRSRRRAVDSQAEATAEAQTVARPAAIDNSFSFSQTAVSTAETTHAEQSVQSLAVAAPAAEMTVQTTRKLNLMNVFGVTVAFGLILMAVTAFFDIRRYHRK